MPYTFTWYPTPLDGAVVTLTPDGGGPLVGSAGTDANGRPCHVCTVPDHTATGHGAQLDQITPGYIGQRLRGILHLLGSNKAELAVDDCTLTAEPTEPAPGPTPPPVTGGTPQEIINRVYTTTHPNLATVEGCGKFTEDCCTALHDQHSQAWGHIDKDPGQNQYNGHAVDALMLLGNAGGTTAGIYDIIFSSASPEAKPVFNYVSPPNYEDWVYPAGAVTRGGSLELKTTIAPWSPLPRRQSRDPFVHATHHT